MRESFQRPSFAANREQLEIVSRFFPFLFSHWFLFSLSLSIYRRSDSLYLSLSLSVFLSFFLFLSSFLIASDTESGRRNESAIRAEETLRVPLAVSIKNNSCLFSVCNSSAYNWPRYNSCMNIRALRSSIKSRSFLDWCINTHHISCLWSTSACNKTFFTTLHLLLIADIA